MSYKEILDRHDKKTLRLDLDKDLHPGELPRLPEASTPAKCEAILGETDVAGSNYNEVYSRHVMECLHALPSEEREAARLVPTSTKDLRPGELPRPPETSTLDDHKADPGAFRYYPDTNTETYGMEAMHLDEIWPSLGA